MYRSEHHATKEEVVERGDTRARPVQYDKICAYDLGSATWALEQGKSVHGEALLRRLHFEKRWELEVPLNLRIAAGDRLYAGAENQIVAVALPTQGSAKPEVAWEAPIDGFPMSVIAAEGRLLVTTDKGQLYCFGTGLPTGAVPTAAPEPVSTDAGFREEIAAVLKRSGASAGYALVYGWGSGGMVRELVRQSKLNVIVAEPDAATAEQARRELTATGVYGVRAQVLCGEPETLRLPPYFAEVVVSEVFSGLEDGGRHWSTGALDALRPFTGVALVPLRPRLREMVEERAKALGGFNLESGARQWTYITRHEAPTGADEWTHENANAGNTFASADTLAKPPFALLWYSGGIDRYFTPAFEYQHDRNPYPTVVSGRMFLLSGNVVDAVDAYTGRHLWKTKVGESEKAERRLSDHRQFSRPADQNVVAAADRLYVFRDASAEVLETATGRSLGSITLPDKDFGEDAKTLWDEARLVGDLLVVAAGNHLVALDRVSGAVRWSRPGTQQRVAFAIGGERIFAVDYATARAAQPGAAGPLATTLRVLQAKDGAPAWEAPLQAAGRPEQEGRIGKNSWAGVFLDSPLKPVLAYNAAHGIVLAIVDRHQYFAFAAASGKPLWQKEMKAGLSSLVLFEPPTVTSDFVIVDSQEVLDVRTGEPAGVKEIGGRGIGCNRVVGSDAVLTFRSALACVLDLSSQKRIYLSSTRTGCTNGMIPAGGLLNSPNFAHGCVCNYPFLTSFALFHLPEAARWAPANAPDVQFSRDNKAE